MAEATSDRPTTTSLAAWRQRLRPWLRALESHLVIDVPALPSRDDMRAMWITLDAAPPSLFNPQPWTVVMEALELLDLLVRVDSVIGWYLLVETARVNRAFATNSESVLFPRDELRPRYRIQLEDADLQQNVAPVFVALLRLIDSADDVEPVRESTLFQPTKRLLLDLWARQHGGEELDRATAGRIEIKPSFLLMSDLKSDFARFAIHRLREVAIVSRPHARPSPLVCAVEDIPTHNITQPRPVDGRPFHLAELDFGCLDHNVTSELAYVLLDIHERGLRISELEIDQLISTQLHSAITSSFFHAILQPLQQASLSAPSSTGFDDADRPRGIRRLIITSGVINDDAIEAICSGIAESQCLREVQFSNYGVRGRAPDRELWWSWLAFALFGSTTCHQIASVTLDVREFDVSDFEAMRRALTHPNPLEYLCALEAEDTSRPPVRTVPMAATFQQGAFLIMGRCLVTQQLDDSTTRAFFTASSNTFQITRDIRREDFVEFLLPGTGLCWTLRVNVVHQFELQRRERESPVRHLKLESVGVASQAAVVELLNLVGASVRQLTLAVHGQDILDGAFLDAVCRAMPRLRRLDIDGDVASLRWLISPPEDGRARCRLDSVSLVGRVMDTSSFVALFDALADRDHPLARSLRAFHYKKGFAWRDDTPYDQIWTAWSDILLTNRTLERSELDVSVDDDEAGAEEVATRFRQHHGTHILLREALAFLSVVVPVVKPAATATTTSTGRLHVEIARAILEMANIPSRRICG